MQTSTMTCMEKERAITMRAEPFLSPLIISILMRVFQRKITAFSTERPLNVAKSNSVSIEIQSNFLSLIIGRL